MHNIITRTCKYLFFMVYIICILARHMCSAVHVTFLSMHRHSSICIPALHIVSVQIQIQTTGLSVDVVIVHI